MIHCPSEVCEWLGRFGRFGSGLHRLIIAHIRHIISGVMNAKEQELFTLLLGLLQDHHQLLGDVLPIVHEIVNVLDAGQKPTDAQLRTWQKHYSEMDRRLHELNAAFVELRQVADPLFRFDT